MRQTCCPPCGFGIASHAGSLQVAVSPCWAQALPVVISANPSLRVWTPTPAAPRVHVPVTSPRTLAFPGETAGRRVAKSPTATSVGGNITELQSFTDVQIHKFARHTGSSHPCVLRRRAAVAFTSAPIRARYLPLQRICFPSKTGQLTEGGLPPPKIGSLDGCSISHNCRSNSALTTAPGRLFSTPCRISGKGLLSAGGRSALALPAPSSSTPTSQGSDPEVRIRFLLGVQAVSTRSIEQPYAEYGKTEQVDLSLLKTRNSGRQSRLVSGRSNMHFTCHVTTALPENARLYVPSIHPLLAVKLLYGRPQPMVVVRGCAGMSIECATDALWLSGPAGAKVACSVSHRRNGR